VTQWRAISVEHWAEIRRLHPSGAMPIKAIARQLGTSRNAVRRALVKDNPPRYQRPVRGSLRRRRRRALRGVGYDHGHTPSGGSTY